MVLLLSSAAAADDLAGQASVIDGDTLEIHGTRNSSGVSTRRRAANYAVTMVVRYTHAARD
jgi:hypothetical protein